MEKAPHNLRPLGSMNDIQLAVKMLACLKGGNKQGFEDAKAEINDRGGKVALDFVGPGA